MDEVIVIKCCVFFVGCFDDFIWNDVDLLESWYFDFVEGV